MKSLKQFGMVLFVALATVVSSCSSSDDGGGGGGNAALGTIKAKVGGSNFTSMTMGTFATKVSAGGFTIMTVQGSDSSGKSIQIVLNGYDGNTGTYEISQEATISTVGSYIEPNLSNPMNSQVWAAPYDGSGVAGSVTITEISETNVKGTFNFTGKLQNGTGAKEVTNGAFNVNFTSGN